MSQTIPLLTGFLLDASSILLACSERKRKSCESKRRSSGQNTGMCNRRRNSFTKCVVRSARAETPELGGWHVAHLSLLCAPSLALSTPTTIKFTFLSPNLPVYRRMSSTSIRRTGLFSRCVDCPDLVSPTVPFQIDVDVASNAANQSPPSLCVKPNQLFSPCAQHNSKTSHHKRETTWVRCRPSFRCVQTRRLLLYRDVSCTSHSCAVTAPPARNLALPLSHRPNNRVSLTPSPGSSFSRSRHRPLTSEALG